MGSSNKKRSNNNNMEHRTGLKQNNTKFNQLTKSKENVTECFWVWYKRHRRPVSSARLLGFCGCGAVHHIAMVTPQDLHGCILKHLQR